MANPKRLEILYTLKDGEMTPGDLFKVVGGTTANLSQHLGLMRQHGLVESRKEGLNIYYRLTSPEILEACRAVRRVLVERLMRQSDLLNSPAAGPE